MAEQLESLGEQWSSQGSPSARLTQLRMVTRKENHSKYLLDVTLASMTRKAFLGAQRKSALSESAACSSVEASKAVLSFAR